MVRNGIYWLRLAAIDEVEEGVAVIRQGMVNGGGPAHVWQGRLVQAEGAVRGTLVVRKWNSRLSSGLGMFKSVSLGVEGRFDGLGLSFELEGRAHGHHVVRLGISGHWLGELADEGPGR